MSHNSDVLVVGGGPVGLIFAEEVGKRGIDITVFEEHQEIGIPSHCAGLVSIKGLARIGVEPPSECIESTINGAEFYSPSNICFRVEFKRPMAFVLNRMKFDQFLAKRALCSGVKIFSGRKAVNFLKDRNKIAGVLDNFDNEFRSEITVSAEGATGQLVEKAGLDPINRSQLIPAIQFELCNVDVEEHIVQVFFGKKYSKNFFAWTMPTGKDTARVGLGSKKQDNYEKLETFVNERFRNAVRTSVRTGFIVTEGPLKRICTDNFLSVGDICGQTKPTTGGGVVLGGIGANIAANAVMKSIENEDTKHSALRRYYERKLHDKLGREFFTMSATRKILNSLSNDTLDKIFKALVSSNMMNEIDELSDMDFQSYAIKRTLQKIMKRNVIFSVIMDMIRNFFFGQT